MLKKRIIFTLLYDSDNFMLSRNFRLQKVGDLSWLQNNYDFSQITFSIDELIILDISRSTRNNTRFHDIFRMIAKECFIPMAAGGGVNSIDQGKQLLRSGADKIVVNSIIATNPDMIHDMASVFGRQCIIASVDVKLVGNNYMVFIENGSKMLESSLAEWLQLIKDLPVGELYLNSIDRDGTGQGYLIKMLDYLPDNWNIPIILAGGAGNSSHLAEGLSDIRVNAVSTAHLFNFIGDGLERSREELLSKGIDLVQWNKVHTIQLRDF